VLFANKTGMQNGTVIGLDEAFRLLVRSDSGEIHALDRGEVVIQ